MRRAVTDDDSYQKLFRKLSALYENARHALVEAYWEIGRRIVLTEQRGAARAAMNTALLERLSRDMTAKYGKGFSVDNLERMRRFYRAYPKSATSRILNWSHYVELLTVSDLKVRTSLEKRVVKDEIPVRELRARIRDQRGKEKASAPPFVPVRPQHNRPLKFIRGALYTYCLKEVRLQSGEKRLALDCGFSVYHDALSAQYPRLKAGDIVRSVKKEGSFFLSRVHETDAKKLLFTYKAYIERVMDGDTIWVYVPCGFGFSLRQKLRLKGIDAPEVTSAAGKAAKRFVDAALSGSDFVIIKTYSPDKFDRYLADVFYLPDQDDPAVVLRSGVLLNQELLDAGHACRMV